MAEDYEIKWYGEAFWREVTDVTYDAMDTAGKMLERDIKLSFGTGFSRMDRVYRVTKFKNTKTRKGAKYHRPSAPGSVPNVMRGYLRASIIHQIIKQGMGVIGLVGSAIDIIKSKTGSDEDYGMYLELGTPKMAARPWLRPALQRNAQKRIDIFQRTLGE